LNIKKFYRLKELFTDNNKLFENKNMIIDRLIESDQRYFGSKTIDKETDKIIDIVKTLEQKILKMKKFQNL
jgi:hypothetical protein